MSQTPSKDTVRVDATDQVLRDLADNVRNSTIDACCKAAMLACQGKEAKEYPLTVATLICNRLRSMRVKS